MVRHYEIKKRKTLELPAELLPFYKEARRVLSRMVKTRELVSFLRECTSKDLSPAGLTVRLRPSSIKDDPEFLKAWEEVQKDSSLKFTNLVEKFHTQSLEKFETAYVEAEDKLFRQCNEEQRNHVESALKQIKDRLVYTTREKYKKKMRQAEGRPKGVPPPTRNNRPSRGRGYRGRGRGNRQPAPRPQGASGNRTFLTPRRKAGNQNQASNNEVMNFIKMFASIANSNNNANNNKNDDIYISDFVINLSSVKLSKTHISVLEKDLNFCPSKSEIDLGKTASELERFVRQLRLKDFFRNFSTPNSQTNDEFENLLLRKFKAKSSWMPPMGRNESIETFAKTCKQFLVHFKQPRHFNNNLSSDEQRALNDLRAMKSIVIKHADKGSAIVIQDSVHYRNEALRQLNNDQFYISTPNNLTKKHQDMVFTLLHKLHEKGEIDDKVFNGLTPRNIRTARFYLLPKIHKCLTPGSVPGRPIISGNGCSTEKISSFVDEHIKPFVKTVPSYIRDTTDFINKLKTLKTYPKHFSW